MKAKIVYMGSSDFAIPALEELNKTHDVLALITQPDRVRGRGKKKRALPIKLKAEELEIPVYQPENIKDSEAVEYLKKLEPDLFVVAAYGQILSEDVLDIPKHGSLNIHASLLPKYRGAAPINRAIIDGEDESGVTIMLLDTGMDTGDVLESASVKIDDKTTVGELHDRLAELGSQLISESIKKYLTGELKPIPQESGATYAGKLKKEDTRIDWEKSARDILRLINGTDPFPKAYTNLDGTEIKLFTPEIVETGTGKPGEILAADSKEGLIVKCGKDALRLNEIQVPGKKRMKTKDYLRGNSIEVGKIFK